MVQAVVELAFFRRVRRRRRSCSTASRSRSASPCAPPRTARAWRSSWRRRSARRRSCRPSRRSCGSRTRSSRSRAACSRSRRAAWRASRRAGADQHPARGADAAAGGAEGGPGAGAGRAHGPGGGAGAGEPVQERVPREHEPRAAHARSTRRSSSAKLLADNKDGNLSDEQVRFAPDDPLGRTRPARPHQRHPRPVAHRGGAHGAVAGVGAGRGHDRRPAWRP
jgi:hypothetical protein